MNSLSIIIPAFNEAEKLKQTVREVHAAATDLLGNFEIIIVNDCSADNTAAVAERLAAELDRVSVIHHAVNGGVGSAYASGVAASQCKYLTVIPGDNAYAIEGIRRLFGVVGAADLIISYRTNLATRTRLRRLFATCSLWGIRLATFRMIRDPHSMYIYRVDYARKTSVARRYGYHIESLASMLRQVRQYIEVPVSLNPDTENSTGVLRPRMLLLLACSMVRILFRVRRKHTESSTTSKHLRSRSFSNVI